MPITFNSFSPSTTISSNDVNTNFTRIKNLLDNLRPQLGFFVPDLLVAANNVTIQWEIKSAQTLYFSSVDLSVKTAPTGAALIVDINKNGSTIFSTRPQIAAGATSGGEAAVFSSLSVDAGDIITVDIDQVGSTEAGRDLSINLNFYL